MWQYLAVLVIAEALAACSIKAVSFTPEDDVAVSCDDAVRNADETDVDCGGSCAPCAAARSCAVPGDCVSGMCSAGQCSEPPECGAQRLVQIVAGNGGLAWFSLLWPAPSVITGFQSAYAFDDPTFAKELTKQPSHPLFARSLGTHAVWEGRGLDPQPSVIVAGANEAHSAMPSSIVLDGTLGLVAAAAVLELRLQPKIGVMRFSAAGPYGAASGAPTPVVVANVDAAISAFEGMIPADAVAQLRPTEAQLARYVPGGASNAELELAKRLAFTANAFRLGVLGSMILPAINDDPHGAFSGGAPTSRIASLSMTLDAFYAELAERTELTCGHAKRAISLADNVVMLITGDTPKNSFNNVGWSDTTPGNANWMYLRSNGFTQPGWFGQVTTSGRINFNATTGELDGNATVASATSAAFAATLYAVSRGNKASVAAFSNAVFDGLILR